MSTVVSEGPTSLNDLVANPSLEEVWVNGPNQVFVAEGGAAVFASESFDPTAVSKQGRRVRAPLTSYRVRQSAEEFLETVGSQDLTMVTLESAHTPDGWHAEVGLSSQWSPPVVSHLLPTTLRIQVEAQAQTFLR
jgi:hypothetical protein